MRNGRVRSLDAFCLNIPLLINVTRSIFEVRIHLQREEARNLN